MLRAVAAVSGLYDLGLGLLLIVAADWLAAQFGVPRPAPRVLAELNGMFLLAVGAGYWLPYRDPQRYRGYLWVMGPLLKGGGALIFVIDYLGRTSPPSYLLFAASDGALALITLSALLAVRPKAARHP